MAIMGISQFTNLQEPILKTLYWDQYEKERMVSDQLFTDTPSTKLTETMLTLTDVGQLSPFTGSSIDYVETEEAYKSEVVMKQYARGLKFTRRFIDTNQYPEYFTSSTRMLARAASRTREQVRMDVFNNAFNTAGDFVMGDTKALCASDHPVPSGDFTSDNVGSTALSGVELSVQIALMRMFKDFTGEPIDANPDILLVHPDNQDLAERITMSDKLALSANNDINPSNIKRLRVLSSVRLTDSNNYFLIDSDLMRMALKCFVVVPPEFGRDKDTDSFAQKFSAYTHFGVGYNHWNWIYGSEVS